MEALLSPETLSAVREWLSWAPATQDLTLEEVNARRTDLGLEAFPHPNQIIEDYLATEITDLDLETRMQFLTPLLELETAAQIVKEHNTAVGEHLAAHYGGEAGKVEWFRHKEAAAFEYSEEEPDLTQVPSLSIVLAHYRSCPLLQAACKDPALAAIVCLRASYHPESPPLFTSDAYAESCLRELRHWEEKRFPDLVQRLRANPPTNLTLERPE